MSTPSKHAFFFPGGGGVAISLELSFVVAASQFGMRGEEYPLSFIDVVFRQQYPRIPIIIPGWSTSAFRRPDRRCVIEATGRGCSGIIPSIVVVLQAWAKAAWQHGVSLRGFSDGCFFYSSGSCIVPVE